MSSFKVFAANYVDGSRISKVVSASSEAQAILAVSKELEDAGFYVVDIKAI